MRVRRSLLQPARRIPLTLTSLSPILSRPSPPPHTALLTLSPPPSPHTTPPLPSHSHTPALYPLPPQVDPSFFKDASWTPHTASQHPHAHERVGGSSGATATAADLHPVTSSPHTDTDAGTHTDTHAGGGSGSGGGDSRTAAISADSERAADGEGGNGEGGGHEGEGEGKKAEEAGGEAGGDGGDGEAGAVRDWAEAAASPRREPVRVRRRSAGVAEGGLGVAAERLGGGGGGGDGGRRGGGGGGGRGLRRVSSRGAHIGDSVTSGAVALPGWVQSDQMRFESYPTSDP